VGAVRGAVPKAIRLFDAGILVSVLLGLASITLSFAGVVYALPDQPPSPIHALSYLSVPVVEMIVVPLFSALAASRERSLLAKWLLTLVTLFMVARWLPYLGMVRSIALPGHLAMGQALVQLASAGLLFTGPARAWLSQRPA
jgi:hypothetical protein